MSNTKALVVNVSAFVDYDIKKAFAAVQAILTKYAPQSSSCLSGSFFSLCGMFELKKQYDQSQQLIGQYKLGQLTTNDFLENFFTVFPFLGKVKLEEGDIDKIIQNKDSLLMMKDQTEKNLKDNPKLAVKALLELAWTKAVIGMEKDKWKKITSEAEKVYLVSNTNLMDINKILFLLAEQLQLNEKIEKSDAKSENEITLYKEEKIEVYQQSENTPLVSTSKQELASRQDIEITFALLRNKFPDIQIDISNDGCIAIMNVSPAIEIFISCLCGTLKTKEENTNSPSCCLSGMFKTKKENQDQGTTPPLVESCITHLLKQDISEKDIILVSQYEKDFEPAKKLLPEKNRIHANDYFEVVKPLKCCIL